MLQNEPQKTATADLSRPWFPIDNASNLYAGARRKNWCRTYRFAVILDEEIKPNILQQALNDTVKRFPTMNAKLKDGLFWSYFEYATDTPTVQKEEHYPYLPIRLTGNDQPNFRILYYKNRLSLEMFHALSDGGGSNMFLTAIVARYYELQGILTHPEEFYINNSAVALAGEVSDSYLQVADFTQAQKAQRNTDILLSDQHPQKGFHRLIHGIMKLDDVKAVAKTYSLTVTEFLACALIDMFIKGSPEPINQNISISIPIDLRRRFDSISVRNFCYMADVIYNPKGKKDVDFNDICDSVRGVLKQKSTTSALLSAISANVAAQSSKVLRPVPYPLKKAFLRSSYKKSQQSFTTFLTNAGALNCSPELQKHILRAELCLGDTPFMHFGCGAVSVNGILNFTFSTSNRDTELPKIFFRFLSSQGLNVRVESNIYE